MKKSISQLHLVPLVMLVFANFALAPIAEAQGRGGGGGGARAQSAGGGARAQGAGANNRQNVQANNSRADARTNNVRSTSVNNVNNNVNVNRNTNVNVEGHGGGGWDNDYHPVATAAAIGATVAVTSAVIGSMTRTVPANCVPVNYGGMVYQQCGSTWYQPQGSQYVVVNPPY
jgi:hypothetical protein